MPIIDSGFVPMSERRNVTHAPDITLPSNENRTLGIAAERKATFAEVTSLIAAESKESPAASAAKPTQPARSFKFWEKEDFGFGDVVDIVNPLQHIPIVSTLYRHWAGDQIGPAPRVIGGALWGRAGGLVAGLINSVVEWLTGKDIGDHIYAMLFGAPQTSPDDTVAAQRKTSPSVSENKAAAAISRLVPELVPQATDGLPARSEARGLSEPTLRTVDPRSDSVIPQTTPHKDPAKVGPTPWPAASALHIFQKHDRTLDRKEPFNAPLLRYIV